MFLFLWRGGARKHEQTKLRVGWNEIHLKEDVLDDLELLIELAPLFHAIFRGYILRYPGTFHSQFTSYKAFTLQFDPINKEY